jgi:hypothetical protein
MKANGSRRCAVALNRRERSASQTFGSTIEIVQACGTHIPSSALQAANETVGRASANITPRKRVGEKWPTVS